MHVRVFLFFCSDGVLGGPVSRTAEHRWHDRSGKVKGRQSLVSPAAVMDS